MTDVSNFRILVGIDYVFNGNRDVILSHVFPVELPVVVSIHVQSLMGVAVLVASRVSKPDIEALPRSLEGWSDIRPVHDPAVG